MPQMREEYVRTTTYAKLEAQGDMTTELRPLEVGEVMAEFAKRSHGHVLKRADGLKARCGGPPMCKTCWLEQQILEVVST